MVRFFKKSLSVAILLTLSCIFSLTTCNSLLDELDAVAQEVERDKWIDDNSAVYTVMHYQQRIGDDDYDLVSADTEYLSGLIGEKTEASAKKYDGFTAQSFEQQEILEDGSTVVSIYYDRNSYTVTFWSGLDKSSLTEVASTSSRYGYQLSLSTTPPDITNYTFAGWTTTFGGEVEYYTGDCFTIPSSNTNLYAVWESYEGGIEVTVTEQIGYISLSVETAPYDRIVASTDGNTYDTYTWIVDGTLLSETTSRVYLSQDEYLSGTHSVTVYGQTSDGSIVASMTVSFSFYGVSFDNTVGEVTMLTGSEINNLLASSFSADSTSYAFEPYTSTPSSAILSDSATIALSSSDSEVTCYAWKSGSTIFYYAKGYTDSANRIPLASDCSGMFAGLAFTSLNLSLFSTSEVTTMKSMFASCSNLVSVDISGFDSSKLCNVEKMFYSCSSLPAVEFPSSFTCASVSTMESMFESCNALSAIDLSYFDSSTLLSTDSMFRLATALSSVTLGPAFTCASVWECSSMFYQLPNLITLDLQYVDFSSVSDATYMFYNCAALTTIITSPGTDWSSITTSTYMFGECTNLTGGAGTAYDDSNITADYARVDGLNGNSGYFTATQ